MDDIEIPTLTKDSLPEYSSDYAAGADIRADIEQSLFLQPGQSALIPTGLYFEIPDGYEIQVRPRSGLALKNQVTVLNSPGTIDSDYRGELKVILINHGSQSFEILPKMRIAQIVVAPVVRVNFIKTHKLSVSQRGTGGFGHTGVH